MDFVCRANLIYPYFIYMIEGYFEKPKSLMTLMTGKRPKHLFIFLMKLLPCLGHCFRSPIVGFYQ